MAFFTHSLRAMVATYLTLRGIASCLQLPLAQVFWTHGFFWPHLATSLNVYSREVSHLYNLINLLTLYFRLKSIFSDFGLHKGSWSSRMGKQGGGGGRRRFSLAGRREGGRKFFFKGGSGAGRKRRTEVFIHWPLERGIENNVNSTLTRWSNIGHTLICF